MLAADKLALISDVGDLLRLNDDAQALLLKSALQVGQDIEYWLNRIPEPTRRIELLSQATQNKLTIVRQRAVETLGTQDVPQSVVPLLTLALHDRNMDVRDTARQSLAQLTTQQPAIVERLKQEVTLSAQAENPTSRASLLRTLTYLPLSGLPLTLRMEVFMMRIRLRMTSFIEASLLTPQRRAMAMTTGLLVVLVAFAYAFSMNSYHVDTKPSGIPGKNIIVIRRGHPQLNLPGIDKVLVETDINTDWIAGEHWETANNGSICGFSIPTVEGNYYKWGQEVAEVLKLEHRVPMLWYLGEQDQARQAILKAMRSEDAELHLKSVLLLGHMVKLDSNFVKANTELVTKRLIAVLEPRFWEPELESEPDASELEAQLSVILAVGQVLQAHPELVEPLMPALLLWLEDNEPHALAYTIGQVVEADSLQGKELINALRQWLSDEDRDTRSRAVSLVEPVIQANSEFGEQLIDPLLSLLEDEESYVRGHATSAVMQIVQANRQLAEQALQANPQLAKQALEALLRLLSDEDSHVRVNAASAIIQIAEPNSQLAQQALQALQRLLEDEDSNVRASATHVVREVNPQLAEQLMPVLLQLLKDNSSDVRNNALFAVESIIKANSQLAEQALQALLRLLEDEDENEESHVRSNAVYTVGRVVKANPKLAGQVMPRLQSLLKDEDSKVRASAVSAVGQVIEPNSGLAEELMPTLLRLLEDEESHVRASAVYAVGQVIERNSKLPKALMPTLLRLLEDEDEDSHVRVSAASVVIQVVEPNAELPEQALRALLSLLKDEDRYVRASVMDVVGQVYTDQKYEAFLFDKLTDPQNALARFPAAQALFHITLQNPIRGEGIDSRLEEQAESLEPMERIWANKTRAMLDIATEAHKISCSSEKECEKNTSRLQTIAYSGYGPDTSFFGEEVTWAAREAIIWLWEQGNEENARTVTK